MASALGRVKVAPLTAGKLVAEATAALLAGAAFADVRAALSSGPAAQCTPLKRERLSQPFESLRDAADRFLERTGKRPTVFLANLGTIPEHKARAAFAANFFEAGGFAVLSNDGFVTAEAAAQAFAASGAEVAALCSSDSVYAELAVPTAEAIAALAPKAIALAGSPGDKEATYRAAGVSDFIFMGTNAYASLRSLLERVGAV
jgi:methylmalonyl-CoA mutase